MGVQLLNNVWQHIVPRYDVLLSKYSIDHHHYTVKFTLANIDQAIMILMMHGHLKENENSLVYVRMNYNLFKNDFYLHTESLESNLEQSMIVVFIYILTAS